MKGAFALLSRAARAGVPEAEFRVGRCYLEGAGVPPSRADGVRWVERAATKGYVEAQALLATLCLHGMGPGFAEAGPSAGAGLFGGQTIAEPDYRDRRQMGAGGRPRPGRPRARRCWAIILSSGSRRAAQPEEGDRWYQKSAAGGCPQGQLGYALVLARDTSKPGDPGGTAATSQSGRGEGPGDRAVSLRHGASNVAWTCRRTAPPRPLITSWRRRKGTAAPRRAGASP